MPCVFCLADGVIQVDGGWYCVKHMHHALRAVAETIVLLAQPKLKWNSDTMDETIIGLLDEAGYQWPDDEQYDEDE